MRLHHLRRHCSSSLLRLLALAGVLGLARLGVGGGLGVVDLVGGRLGLRVTPRALGPAAPHQLKILRLAPLRG